MEDYFNCVKEEMELRDELRLIGEVRRRDVIYSKTRIQNCRSLREDAWAEVAIAMQLSEVDCRKKWRNLRDNFVRDGGCDGATNSTPFLRKYFAEMEFIKEHVVRKTSTTTLKKKSASRPSSPTVVYENGDFEYTDETTQYNDNGSVYEDGADIGAGNDFKSIDPSYSPTNESRIEYAQEIGHDADAPASTLKMDTLKKDTLNFINEVKKHNVLYTRSCVNLNYRHERNHAWARIASAVQMNVHECKYRWKTLRDRFVKDYGALETGAAAPVWEYYQHMEFIKGHIRRKTTTTPTTANIKKPRTFRATSAADNYSAVYELPDTDEAHLNSDLLDIDIKPGHEAYESLHATTADAVQADCTAAEYGTSSFQFDYSQENDTISEIDLTTTMSESSPAAAAAVPSVELSAADNTVFSSFLNNVEDLAARRLCKTAAKHSKHQAFFNLAAEKLDQLSSDDQEEAQMFFLSYLHKKTRMHKKRRKY